MDFNPLKTGAQAPAFSLKNQNELDTKPLEAPGRRRVLLSFHPMAWTSVCEIQMRSLEAKYDALNDLEITAYGISCDPVPSKAEWGGFIEVEETNLLSDFWPHGEVSDRYGLFDPTTGLSGRANFLIDPDGTVEWVKVYELLEIPDIEEIIRFIKSKTG